MSLPHLAMAVAIAIVWGVNFVFMKVALKTLPPFLFAFLRFAFAAVPLVFLYRRPAVPWRLLVLYASTQFALQYAFLFVGLKLGMPAGLSSAVIQLQAFFTIGLAIAMLGDVPRRGQLWASALALSGMAIIAWHVDGGATLLGLLLVVMAALSWGFGNVFTKRIAASGEAMGRPIDVMALVAWGSLIASPPLLALSLVFEGPARIVTSLAHLDWRPVAAVLFNAYGVTTFGFGAWSFLIRRYSTAMVAPFALLVPIAGMGSAALLLDEALHGWALAAGALVVAGLAVNQASGRRVTISAATPRSS